ncbi:MAG: hypothetical protein DRO36_03710 [Candidatus Hecatellales archaeon]|nr:MAG: hypothetical protein DRO36_03710 [Candidatus Hecatellales archaeon]
MAFQSILENAVKKFNDRFKVKPEFQKILQKYDGRSVTLNIKGDTIYVFYLSSSGVTLKTSPKEDPEDMYVEMDKDIFGRFLEERRLNVQDLLRGRIKWKNISLKQVKEIKKILGISSLKDLKDKKLA